MRVVPDCRKVRNAQYKKQSKIIHQLCHYSQWCELNYKIGWCIVLVRARYHKIGAIFCENIECEGCSKDYWIDPCMQCSLNTGFFRIVAYNKLLWTVLRLYWLRYNVFFSRNISSDQFCQQINQDGFENRELFIWIQSIHSHSNFKIQIHARTRR